jgi:hypothetical protein
MKITSAAIDTSSSSRYRLGIVASRFEEKKISLESQFLSNVIFQVVDFLLRTPTEPEHLQWSVVLLPANACGSKCAQQDKPADSTCVSSAGGGFSSA